MKEMNDNSLEDPNTDVILSESITKNKYPIDHKSEDGKNRKIVNHSRKYMIFLLVYLILYEVFDTYTCSYYAPLVDLVTIDFGILEADYYFMIFIASFGVYFAIFVQMFTDIIGRKPVIILSFFGMGFSSWMLSLSGNPLSYTTSLFFMSIFFSSDIWCIVISEEAPTDKRAIYNSLIGVFGLFPSILIPILYTYINRMATPRWQLMCLFGIVAMPVAFLGLFMKETQAYKSLKEKRIESKYSKKNIIESIMKPFMGKNRNKILIFLIAGFILGTNAASFSAIEKTFSNVLRDTVGWESSFWGNFGISTYKDFIGLCILASGGGSVIFFTATGILAEKFGRRIVMYLYSLVFFLSTIELWLLITFFSSLDFTFATMALMFGFFLENGSFYGNAKIQGIFSLESFDTDIRGFSAGWRSFSRAFGLSIGAVISGFLVMFVFPSAPHNIYLISGTAILIVIPLTRKFLPETKGKDLF